MKVKLSCLLLFLFSTTFGQTIIVGKVIDSIGNSIPGVKIQPLSNSKATYSDFIGEFVLKDVTLPTSIKVSSYGYKSVEVNVADATPLSIVLKNEVTALSEIVISASRTQEKLIETPVTIERMSERDIKNSTASTYYDGLENLKEVHINTGSIIQKSINTRGFATAANPRFMQLVDGMENTSPSLNVVIGNTIGLSELDVESIEILPGASSALYGANAFNGILFMNGKSPFSGKGISFYLKQGVTNQNVVGSKLFNDFGLRLAHKFSDKFAAKTNITFLKGTDWLAVDTRNVSLLGRDLNPNQNYNGLNLYGDEIAATVTPLVSPTNIGLVSRTPYTESDLNDGKFENFKFDASLHYKPNAGDLEIILQQKIGYGTTNYSASDARTFLRNFLLRQTKLELKGKNFFIRGYLTGQDSGDSFSMTRAAWSINEAWKSNKTWFTDFGTAYATAQAVLGNKPEQSLSIARNFADNNIIPVALTGVLAPSLEQPRLIPGSQVFKDAYNTISKSTGSTGAKFDDNSRFYHGEGNYNFREQIKFAEIQLGGSARKYVLDSKGTLYTDKNDKITYSEFGVYSQIQKKLISDRLKFTGSVRYDKSSNFSGNFSPRMSVSFAFGKNRQRNLRASFQTGFRNPATQDQYYGLIVGPVITFLGSATDNLTRFNEIVTIKNPAVSAVTPTATITGNNVFNDAFTEASVLAFRVSKNPTSLVNVKPSLVKPEEVKSYELGYRADIEGYNFDINGYYNEYKNFITNKRVIVPYYGYGDFAKSVVALVSSDFKIFQIVTNSTTKVTSRGVGFGVVKKINNYDFGFSFNYAELKYNRESDPDFQPGFNTPKRRMKLSFGNEKLFKNFGFATNLRYNSRYQWQPAVVPTFIDENTVFDAQINYMLPKFKTTIKVGADNLFGKDYAQVLGSGLIGRQAYVTLTYNP
jgi:iron complex outermembrane recepter protein